MIVVGVRFKPAGKIYYFDPDKIELALDDGVIVETARGMEFGNVVIPPRDVEDSEVVQPLKPIIRKATAKDLRQVERNKEQYIRYKMAHGYKPNGPADGTLRTIRVQKEDSHEG